jgi:hypothetical protein
MHCYREDVAVFVVVGHEWNVRFIVRNERFWEEPIHLENEPVGGSCTVFDVLIVATLANSGVSDEIPPQFIQNFITPAWRK